MLMTFGLTFFFIPFCVSSSSRAFSLSWVISTAEKSYGVPFLPKRLEKQYNQSLKRIHMFEKRTYSLSSCIQSYCFSKLATKLVAAVFSFANACMSCSNFLSWRSASEIACFLALMTRSSSLSSLSKRVRVARSSWSFFSAFAWDA